MKLALALMAMVAVAAAQPTARQFRDSERRYWAFQKVVKPAPPPVKNRAGARSPIDAFVLAKLEEKKLVPNPRADRITLIRRVSLDVTGLPPTPEEVQVFLADTSAQAYEKLVDRLLAGPRYGERWARHWLDLAHYGDTNGFRGDEIRRNMWRYRDYIIESFNQDKPYDRFVKEQLAGDELYPDESAARIATGFNRNFTDEFNMNCPAPRRQEILNDITDTVGSVFMGLTYGCARCHDHKFDPILQKDYYRLQAHFANTRNEDSLNVLGGEDLHAYQQKLAVWEEQTKEIRSGIDALIATVKARKEQSGLVRFQPEIRDAFLTPPDKRTPIQRQMFYRAREFVYGNDEDLIKGLRTEEKKRYDELAQQIAKYDNLKPPSPPIGQGMVDDSREAPPTHVLAVGVWDAKLEEVQPGYLSILDPVPAKIVAPQNVNSTGRRSALANWLTKPDNPLTARVMVNRVWHYHFGRGIVGTPSDFGVMGDRPTHKELLDYLSATFVENGWSLKKLHRMILLSNAYQQSSAYQPKAGKIDSSNKLLWRFERRRLEGEAIRDSMLSVSRLLNLKMGGPGVYPLLPPGITLPPKVESGWPEEKDPAEANRRSVYVFVKRNMIYPMIEAFDFPNSHESCARRFATVTLSQSLALLNSELVQEWAGTLASRVINDAGLSLDGQIQRVYRMVFSRPPKPSERLVAMEFLKSQEAIVTARLARNEKVAGPAGLPAGVGPAHAAAFADFCHILLNSNEFLYIN